MVLFLVTYDLRKRKNYPELWRAMEELDGFKPLESVYLVDLADSVSALDLLNHLREHIDDDDGMLVVPFSEKPAPFKCKQGTAVWMKAHFG